MYMCRLSHPHTCIGRANIEHTELKFCLHLPPFPFQECTLVFSVLKAWVGLGQPGSACATYYCYARRV